MTTETRVTPAHTGSSVVSELAGSSAAGVLAGGVLAGLAALTTGLPGVRSVALATGAALVVFGLGSFVVSAVAEMVPQLALMVAMLTYVLQMCLIGLGYWRLTNSELLDGTLDRAWLGGSLIALTLVWSTVQVVLHARAVRRLDPLEAAPSTGDPALLPRGEG